MITIYLAAPLFNVAQRIHNLVLCEELERLGYKVILPQIRALNFRKSDGSFDTKGIAKDCLETIKTSNPDEFVFVGCLDGPDADSGTTVEFSAALHSNVRAVLYRTDFRTNLETECGVNAMFQFEDVPLIYLPCGATTREEFVKFYEKLAYEINCEIQIVMVQHKLS